MAKTRIVCVSDTHNTTPSLPKGDVLIHAGDLTNQGTFGEVERMVGWIEGGEFERKVVVGGRFFRSLVFGVRGGGRFGEEEVGRVGGSFGRWEMDFGSDTQLLIFILL